MWGFWVSLRGGGGEWRDCFAHRMGKKQRPIAAKDEVSGVCAQLSFIAELYRAEELILERGLSSDAFTPAGRRRGDGVRSPQHNVNAKQRNWSSEESPLGGKDCMLLPHAA